MQKSRQQLVLSALLAAHLMVVVSFGWKLEPIAYWIVVNLLILLVGTAYWFLPKFEKEHRSESWKDVVALIVGCLSTFSLHAYTDWGAVLSASIIGVLASFIPKSFGATVSGAAYCGAFVGMTSPQFIMNLGGWPIIIIGAFVAGMIFTHSKDVFRGVGGKHGTIAFIGVLTAVVVAIVIRYFNVMV